MQIRKDNPHHLEVFVHDKKEPETVQVRRGRSRANWKALENTLDSLDWYRLNTRTEDDAIIGSYEPDEPEEESGQVFDPTPTLNPEDPDVQKSRVQIEAICSVLDRFIAYERVHSESRDQFMAMIMSRVEALEAARLEDNELLRQKALEMAKLDKGSERMNAALQSLLDVGKQVAPDLMRDILGGMFSPKAGPSTPGRIPGPGNNRPNGTVVLGATPSIEDLPVDESETPDE